MNRMHKRSIFTRAQVEEALEVPVIASFANIYQGVNDAATQGTWVNPTSFENLVPGSFRARYAIVKQWTGYLNGWPSTVTERFSSC